MKPGPEIESIRKGFEFYQKKEYLKCLDYYQRAIEVKPNDIVILLDIADLLIEVGRPEEAISVCDQILKIDPKVSPKYGRRVREIGNHIKEFEIFHINWGESWDAKIVFQRKLSALQKLKRWNEVDECQKQILDLVGKYKSFKRWKKMTAQEKSTK